MGVPSGAPFSFLSPALPQAPACFVSATFLAQVHCQTGTTARGAPWLRKVTWGCPRDSAPSRCPSEGPCSRLSALQASWLADGPVRRLGLEAGAWHPGGPGGQQSRGGAHGPHFCSVSDLPVSVSDPQPETEDEKKRFEEGKGRYLQMKAKRQGKAEPQP